MYPGINTIFTPVPYLDSQMGTGPAWQENAIELAESTHGSRSLALRSDEKIRTSPPPHSQPDQDFLEHDRIPEHDHVPTVTSPPLAPADGAASSFDPRLESLRGLAALLVCVHHGMSVFADNVPLGAMSALLYAFNSASAVIFFFALSGYVLGRALERDGNFLPYLTRRLFRLLPPFVVVVLFTFACERLFRIDPAPSGLMPGFQRMFWPAPTWDALWDNLLLRSFKVNGPTWTLLLELVGAVMLPFVVAAHVRVGQRWRWAMFAAISALLAISPFHMLLWFYAGYFLANEIGTALAGQRWLAAAMFVSGVIGLGTAGTNSEFYAVGIVIPSAMSAALMIGAVAASRELLQWTTVAPLRFLGRISYSLYLVHWPTFYVCALLAVACRPIVPTHDWGNLIVMVTSAIVAIGLAALSYRFVEAPSIKAGKSVAIALERVLAWTWRYFAYSSESPTSAATPCRRQR
jgi:peptidoglycan/LPS O-acetylase OafA/YrhL